MLGCLWNAGSLELFIFQLFSFKIVKFTSQVSTSIQLMQNDLKNENSLFCVILVEPDELNIESRTMFLFYIS